MLIYINFEPLNIKQQKFDDVPIFELKQFSMYEFNTDELETLMKGDIAIRYEDRYTLSNIDYTDNSKQIISNMKAKDGIYKDNIVTLSDDVVYNRADGLVFESQKIRYNKKSAIVVSPKEYTGLIDNKSKVSGSYLKYDVVKKKLYSKNILIKYQIED
jgi:hypothetical protein